MSSNSLSAGPGSAGGGKDLKGFFEPRSVAVIGASPNEAKIGHQILKNIVGAGFSGEIIPIHPKAGEILGHKAFPSVKDVPSAIDLAVVSIPAPLVYPALEECAEKNIKNIVIITSGFAEVGKTEDEQKIKDFADAKGLALIGPNTLGIVYVPSNLNASFGPQDVQPGKIAFISQSGALAISLMGWTMMEKIGLTSLISLGNKADVEEKELIEYFNTDSNVDSIVIYMEGIKDGRKFLQTDIQKPVIVLKVGRSQRGAKAAASHTGSLSGSDKIYDAAFEQLGILRADTFTEAFNWSRALSLPLPDGNESLIITNGGGIGVAATDQCERHGLHLLEDLEWMEEKFRSCMPDFGSTKNPIDITGQGHGAQYRQATGVGLAEDRIKTLIILYCETAVTDPMEIAQSIEAEYTSTGRKKPLIVTMVGGERSRAALHYLNERQVPAFGSVDEAISSLKALYVWKEIKERAQDRAVEEQPPAEAVKIIEDIRAEGRTYLMEQEARKVMELCGVPTPKWGFATTEEEAVSQAQGMYPLAMKIASPDIVHKTDVGGVMLNIRDDEELKAKYREMMDKVKQAAPDANLLGVNLIQMMSGIECIVGMSRDPQFGPVVMFGLGGVFVEALKDVSFRIVPFGQEEARRLIGEIKSKKVLDGFRGLKADKESIIQTLCAVQKLSSLVKEVDINPLITNDQGSYAVDARIIL